MYDFNLVCADTDSITINKKDGKPFEKEEIELLTKELNSLFEEGIKWEFEFSIPRMIVLKAKNYIMFDGEKIKLKGSSLKSSTMEPKLKAFCNEMIDALVFDKKNYTEIYNKYVQEILDIKDIKPWCSKKTISGKTLESERTNESKIRDAFEGTEYVEGDKLYLFFTEDGGLCLAEKFDGNYDRKKLLEKLFKATKRFETVLPIKELFINYSLVKNYKILMSTGLQIAS